jgi:hypothetical protein
VTTLLQKLNQLSLTSMARQLDQTITDAGAKNRSFAESLESLIDCELESRDSHSIERRFRLSRLHARHSIDSVSSNGSPRLRPPLGLPPSKQSTPGIGR